MRAKIGTLRAAVAFSALLAGSPLHAAERLTVSLSDLRATARSLGFLDTLRHDGTILIGIVYASPNERVRRVCATITVDF